MSFLLTCPNCGERPVAEFRFGGEYHLRPSGEHFMEDLDEAGGIKAVLSRLVGQLHEGPSVNGRSVVEVARSVEWLNEEVIRPLDRPIRPEGGIAVLAGSLAPDGAVVKQSGDKATSTNPQTAKVATATTRTN